MKRSTCFVRVLTAALLVWIVSPLARAQSPTGQDTAWVVETLRRYNLTAVPADVEKIAGLRTKILAPAGTMQDRFAAFQEIYSVLARLQGSTAVPQATVAQGCMFPAFLAHARLSGSNTGAPPASFTRLGELAHVEKVGTGPIPMILVPDYGTDWTLYRTFMERNRDRYTMYAVTLPGFGGSPAPPRPKAFDPARTPWWDAAEKGLLDLIARSKLDRPVVVGMQTGAYLAARVALDHPEKIRGAILLNGFVNVPVRTADEGNAPMTLDERRRRVSARPDLNGLIADFIPEVGLTPSEVEAQLGKMPPQNLPFVLGRNTRDLERGRALFVDFLSKTDPRVLGYFFELSGTDLTFDMARLRVPMLVVPSVPDAGAPPAGASALAQWQEVKRLHPAIPLALTPIENTRNYATEDAPAELDKTIASFFVAQTERGVSRK
jgi:pimeloyl-ACP methyl ester carboxylesterase